SFRGGARAKIPARRGLDPAGASRATRRGRVRQTGKRYLQCEHLLKLGPDALAYLTELTHRRPQVWLRDIDRLHTLLATYGDDAMRAAFPRGVAEHAIGAEYIAHFLADAVTPPRPIEGDSPGRRDARSSLIEHPGQSSLSHQQLSLDLPSASANSAPRGAR